MLMGTKQIKREHEDFINSMLESAKRKDSVKVESPLANIDEKKVEDVAKNIMGIDKKKNK